MADHTETLGRVEFRTRSKGRILGSVTHHSGSWIATVGDRQTLHHHFHDALREALDGLAHRTASSPAPPGTATRASFRCARTATGPTAAGVPQAADPAEASPESERG